MVHLMKMLTLLEIIINKIDKINYLLNFSKIQQMKFIFLLFNSYIFLIEAF